MRLVSAIFALAFLSVTAQARDLTVTFTDQEQQAFKILLETAVASPTNKNGPIDQARIVAYFANKLDQAMNTPPPVPVPPGPTP